MKKNLFWKEFGAGILIILSTLSIVLIQPISAETAPEDEIQLDFSFQEPVITEVNISNTTYHEVTMNETEARSGKGLPTLPFKPLKILLPQKGVLASINVTYEGNTSLGDGYNVFIGNGSVNRSVHFHNMTNVSNFNTSIPYPTKPFRNLGISYFRGYSILLLNLYPVYYIGDTGEIYYYNNMSVTITTNNNGSVNPFFRNLTKDEMMMKQMVDDFSMNYTYTSMPDPLGNSSIINSEEEYDLVIITREDFIDAPKKGNRDWYTFKFFEKHKNDNMSISTTIKTVKEIISQPEYWVDGTWGDNNPDNPFYTHEITNTEMFNDTQAKIRNFIRDAYFNCGIEYVLLGGDNSTEDGEELVPVRNLYYGYAVGFGGSTRKEGTLPSDLYYACLDGNFNADEDKYWGEPLDGYNGGDFYEPPKEDNDDAGDYYAEADSYQYESNFEVGLVTPIYNLSGYSWVNLRFFYRFRKISDQSAEVRIYSGENIQKTFPISKVPTEFDEEFNIDNFTDNTTVYIEFYYNEGSQKEKSSWNIDDVSFGTQIDPDEFLFENFEDLWVENNDGDLVPDADWTQRTYNQKEGVWTQEHYREDIDLEAEVFIGRAPVGDHKEVSNFVYKTWKYEVKIPRWAPFFYEALLVGGVLDWRPVWDDPEEIEFCFSGDFCDEIKVKIPTTFDSMLYDRDIPITHYWTRRQLRRRLNFFMPHIIYEDGHGFTNQILRHCYKGEILWYKYIQDQHDPNAYSWKNLIIISRFTNLDADCLVNANPFFLYAGSCLIGAFDNYYQKRGLTLPEGIYHKQDCLAEHLTVKTKHGAFAVILNAREGFFNWQHDSPTAKLALSFFDKAFDYTLGEANKLAKDGVENDVEIEDEESGFNMRMCVYETNLLGDPTISINFPIQSNSPPSKPTKPEPESSIPKLQLYTFSTSSTDPEGDKVSYKWKVDDNECIFWTRLFGSGETASKTLGIPKGEHMVYVKARDIFLDGNDEWSLGCPVTVSFNLNMNIYSSPVVLGEETQFYGQALQGVAEPVSTWNYTFGDENYGDEQNTNHTYGEVGTYNVTLTVTDSQNIISNVTKIIKVVILKSDINSSSDHGDPNESISFNDLSGGYYNISSWYWDFGDGNTSNNRNTSHAYASEGVYNVSLNVTDAESNTNVSYQTIYIDTGDPEIASASSDLDEVGYGYKVTITANLSDSVSGIKTAAVNVTYPDNTYGNFTMNNTNGSIYEYVFNDTCQLGGYSYKIWVVDNAENLDSSSSKSLTVLRSFGYRFIGGSNQSIWDTITGTRFKVNLKGVADNVSVYIDPGNATSDSHYQCMIYRHNDSKLMGISEEKNVTSGKGWQMFNFSVPKPVLMNDTEYVLGCWADNYTIKMYYDDANEEEMFYDDGSSTLIGHYFEGVYNYTPDINNFEHEDRRYSIYCRYTPDNTSPEITNVSDAPGTVGFGFNVTVAAGGITDNASGVNTVTVNVTYPDNTTDNFTMNHAGNNTYEHVFSAAWLDGQYADICWLVGQYNYTIWAVDYAGNSNSSSGHSFTVSAQATLSIATLKNSYGSNEYINITDPPSPPDDYYLVGCGLTWNEYYNATSGRNILEIYTSPVNYQDESGSWTPIECNISLIDDGHPAYSYGYRAGNDHGLYHVYFKPNAQDNWPVAFAYNKSSDPGTHVIRSKLLGVGYLDPSQGWAYEYLQSVQSSQGQIDGNSATYENVFTGTDVVWTYGNTGLKEEIIMSNATKTVLQDHPPSEYGLSNQDSYLVFITKLDYHTLQLYNSSGVLNGNFTTSDGRIDFKDALGRFKCTLPVGEAYELYNESVRHKLVYRVLQYNGNYYLLSGLKAVDLNDMTFPVVIDPSLTVYSSFSDGDIMGEGTPYASVQNAAEGSPRDMESTFTIGQRCNFGPYYFIWRAFVFFDTSSIPSNDLIDSATLSLYKDSDFSLTDFDIVVQNGQPTYPHIPLLPFDYDKNRYSGNGGSFNTVGFSSGYNDISLTDYSWINTSGTTKLCLRSSRDINSNTPTGDEYVTVYSSNYPLEGRSPKLVIEYRNQSKIKNTGSTDIKGYLLMKVEYYNISAVWASDYVAVDDTTPRTVNSSEQLALDLIFNGLVNTNDLTHGDGTYRVYAAFRDPDGNILQTNDEKDMVSWYEFEVSK